MQATRILGEEHRWIELMLECLETLAERAHAEGALEGEPAAELLYLLESFADGQHQYKEEEVLFLGVIDKADESQQRYLRRLLDDHVAERDLMSRLRNDLFGAIHGEPLSVRGFVRQARNYVALQRKHMAHERIVVLPFVDRLLSEQEDDEIVAGFHNVEATGPDPAGVSERVRALCGRLGVGTESEA